MRSYLSKRAGCLYRQTAGSWNVLDTLSNVIICNHLSASGRFRHVPEPSMGFHEVPWDSMRFHEVPWDSMRFHGIPWGSMRFYDVPVNRSVPTEANRGLTSYICAFFFVQLSNTCSSQASPTSLLDHPDALIVKKPGVSERLRCATKHLKVHPLPRRLQRDLPSSHPHRLLPELLSTLCYHLVRPLSPSSAPKVV
jgi:hypothetical protein